MKWSITPTSSNLRGNKYGDQEIKEVLFHFDTERRVFSQQISQINDRSEI
jgi:hypothetical protein